MRSFAGGYASHSEGGSATLGESSHSEGGHNYGYTVGVTSLNVGAVNNRLCTITYTLATGESAPSNARAVAINDQLFYISSLNSNGSFTILTSYRPDITGCHVLYFYDSVAVGNFSHAEGSSLAYGSYSHAEGEDTTASTVGAHAEGI